MHPIQLTIPSHIEHLSQILAGFLMLREQGRQVEFRDVSRQADHRFAGLPVLLMEYRGLRVVYDLWDGYQDPAGIRRGLDACDVYFKRSFSREKNQALFPEQAEKMHPLGFNYHLIYPGDPIQEPLWKALAKPLLGRTPDRYFRPQVFEGSPEGAEPPNILFQTRLWDPQDPSLSREENLQRAQINHARIEILRTLRSRYGERFCGGLNDSPLSRALAPELILPPRFTERRRYLELVHRCGICIGTVGLHDSIGWKTGEYVAAARAIVHDPLCYEVPGTFAPEVNYLQFSSARQCIDQVARLVECPQQRLAMQQANADYYRQYLRPDRLVGNTLQLLDSRLDTGKEP